MSPEKEKSFRDHINKQMKKFKVKISHLAIENDYPYITAILEEALNKMHQNIKEGNCDCRSDEYKLKGWDIE